MDRPTTVRTTSPREWQGLINENFLPLSYEFARPLAFTGSACAIRLGDMLAAEISVDASRVTRLRRDADHDERACFKVLWQLAGTSRIMQGTRDSLLRPGHWSVYDTRRPYSIEAVGAARFIVLLVPQHARYGWSAKVEALAGRALPGHYGARVAMASLATLLREEQPPDDDGQLLLEASTVALLEHALACQAGTLPALPAPGDRLAEAQSWIGRRLHDTTLGPAAVAAAMNLSRRSLYSLFMRSGTTPHAYIRQQRLALACRLLVQPGRPALTVTEIAQRCGFADPAHFSRAFTQALGCPPSAWRARSG